MLYHDAATAITPSLLTGDGGELQNEMRIVCIFRATPWGCRIIYKRNEVKDTNYLEIKRMEPTLTTEGIVASFRMVPAPHVRGNDVRGSAQTLRTNKSSARCSSLACRCRRCACSSKCSPLGTSKKLPAQMLRTTAFVSQGKSIVSWNH